MIHFSEFLAESVKATEKLSHLEHAEDHVLNAGAHGFKHATSTLIGTHHALLGHKSKVKLTTKYDGAPSIVFGTHPENKKFFVASKSAFNKTPKINYSHDDIDRNHGHAPGLANKLKGALEHLPKTTPHGRVFQGDVMHSHEDRSEDKTHHHFTPNTIKYSVKKNSPEGQKISKSKFGVAVHTEYKGNNFGGMKAKFGPDTSKFKGHDDVHVMHVQTDHKKANYDPKSRVKFFAHINKAKEAHEGHDYAHLSDPHHQMHVKTYINQTVRDGSKPTVGGLVNHIVAKHEKLKASVKTDKTRQRIDGVAKAQVGHIEKHREGVQKTLTVHKHLQNAKHVLVKALAPSDHYEHSIGNKKSGPEGHVAFLGNKPTKLVDRSAGGFASANLIAGGIAKAKKPK